MLQATNNASKGNNMAHEWNYCGDISLAYGGYFWREDGSDDYVLCVHVQPCSDADGPDNLFWIEQGSIYMPEDADKRRRALEVCGWGKEEKPSRAMLVEAFLAYGSFDLDCMNGRRVVRFGPAQPARREFGDIEPDVILRANANLEKYVKNNFLD
jgi:hypothetical protein